MHADGSGAADLRHTDVKTALMIPASAVISLSPSPCGPAPGILPASAGMSLFITSFCTPRTCPPSAPDLRLRDAAVQPPQHLVILFRPSTHHLASGASDDTSAYRASVRYQASRPCRSFRLYIVQGHIRDVNYLHTQVMFATVGAGHGGSKLDLLDWRNAQRQ